MISVDIYVLCGAYMLNPGGAATSCAVDRAGAITKAASAIFNFKNPRIMFRTKDEC